MHRNGSLLSAYSSYLFLFQITGSGLQENKSTTFICLATLFRTLSASPNLDYLCVNSILREDAARIPRDNYSQLGLSYNQPFCYAFVRVCLLMPSGRLLGKG